jgi:hypothetical protein
VKSAKATDNVHDLEHAVWITAAEAFAQALEAERAKKAAIAHALTFAIFLLGLYYAVLMACVDEIAFVLEEFCVLMTMIAFLINSAAKMRIPLVLEFAEAPVLDKSPCYYRRIADITFLTNTGHR